MFIPTAQQQREQLETSRTAEIQQELERVAGIITETTARGLGATRIPVPQHLMTHIAESLRQHGYRVKRNPTDLLVVW